MPPQLPPEQCWEPPADRSGPPALRGRGIGQAERPCTPWTEAPDPPTREARIRSTRKVSLPKHESAWESSRGSTRHHRPNSAPVTGPCFLVRSTTCPDPPPQREP